MALWGVHPIATRAVSALVRYEIEAGLNILVVDDELSVTVSIRLTLKSRGHSVDSLDRAPEALERLKQYPDHYHILITDHLMPGMTGLELLTQLKQTAFKGKIIVISAYLTAALEGQYKALGADMIMQKPFVLDELRMAVEELRPLAVT
jgi:CheY-like chemotaxis protein